MTWTLVLHGGAGKMTRATVTPAQAAGARAALGRALDAGIAILSTGGAALDAVEAAVRVLEDDPHFNAGRGAALTQDGAAELDAAVMNGRDRDAGAVTGVTATRHPVSLARAVMEHSPHVLLGGAGADTFSREQGCEQATQDWFVLPERRRATRRAARRRGGVRPGHEIRHGRCGGVRRGRPCRRGDLDRRHHRATLGRVGDSPLIGAGTYADDRAGAVSCTGSGEFFIRVGVAHEICARVRLTGATLDAAAATAMAEVAALGGTGGVIVAGPRGEAVWHFTTPDMYRARASSNGMREIAVFGDE